MKRVCSFKFLGFRVCSFKGGNKLFIKFKAGWMGE